MSLDNIINQIHVADTLQFTKTLPDNSIDTILFSPPYWGLREYNIDSNLGQESTWHEYISHMVGICEELKRVMKIGGSMWMNIGDTFWGGGGATGIPYDWDSISTQNLEKYPQNGAVTKNKCGCPICIPKQKIGMPMRMRLALNDIGFISRDDIIWYKPNHMPGSQRDRFTVSYEFLFRFVKNNNKKTWWYNQKKREWKDTPQEGEDWAGYHYYFDLDSVRKPHLTNEGRPGGLVRTRELNYNSKYN